MTLPLTELGRNLFALYDAGGNARAPGPGIARWSTEIERGLEGAAEGRVDSVTWAGLSAIAGTRAGQPGQALGPDAGTHTDPVVGGTVANIGTYIWSTSPAGWRRVGGLPSALLYAENAGAGTANAIVATTSLSIPTADGAALIALPIVATNTSTTVTVAFNGGTALAVKSISGGNPAIGALTAGSYALGTVTGSGTVFQLFSERSGAVAFDHQGTYDNGTSYVEGQVVTGSDGKWYQLKTTDATGDDPVSGGSGDWLEILESSSELADDYITEPKLADSLALTLTKVVADETAMLALDTSRYGVANVNSLAQVFRFNAADMSSTLLGSAIASSAVDSGTETITSVAHGLGTCNAVVVTAAVNGLSANTIYYVIRVDADNFRLAATHANAIAGTAFNLTGTSAMTVHRHFDPMRAIYKTPLADISGASGAWVRDHDEYIDTRWAGASTSEADNSPFFQGALDVADLLDLPVRVAGKGTYPFTTGCFIRESFKRVYSDDAGQTILRWDNATGHMFRVGFNDPANDGALLAPQFENLRFQQGSSYTPTAGSCFYLNRVAQATFDKIRTDNFFVHFDTYGLTRPVFTSCRAYGSTLFSSGTVVSNTAILKINEFDLGGSTYITPANIIVSGCEWTSNDATRKNMQAIIEVRGCDGLFIDAASYIGLAKTANLRFNPARAASTFTNIQVECFNDGGQSSSDNCVEFTESSSGFMTGACNSIRIGGILSGPSGSGIRQNILNMADLKSHATIKACAAYGINWIKGAGLNIAGTSFFSNTLGDIANPTGATIFGSTAAKTDKTINIASAGTITLPPVGDVFNITGSTNINTVNGGWPGRKVFLRVAGALTFGDGTGNLDLAGGFTTTGTNDTLTLVTIDGANWFEITRSGN